MLLQPGVLGGESEREGEGEEERVGGREGEEEEERVGGRGRGGGESGREGRGRRREWEEGREGEGERGGEVESSAHCTFTCI